MAIVRLLLVLLVVVQAVAIAVPARGARAVVLGPGSIPPALPVSSVPAEPFFRTMTSDDVARGFWTLRDEGVRADPAIVAAALKDRDRVQALRSELRAARARWVGDLAHIAALLGPERVRAAVRL